MNEKLPNKWLYIPLLVLGIYFIIRLINQSQIISYFPLDYTNDISSYMAQLFFLKVCGFYHYCPYWYNGFITFQFSPPGWYIFTLPIYNLLKNIQVTVFTSLIAIYILSFVFIWFYAKKFKFSKTKKIAFFLFFLANAITIGNFIRLGRIHELFAWSFFIPLTFLALHYKDNKLDKQSLWMIVFYSIILISHQTVAILSSFLFLSLFLIKSKKEKILIILFVGISILLTSFWLVPYTKDFFNTGGQEIIISQNLFKFDKPNIAQNIAAFVIPFFFWIIFYLYWKSNNKLRKELIFFLPILILSVLLFFRITPFIPALKYVYPDPHMHLFIFLGIFMFFSIDLNSIKYSIKKIIPIALVIIALISISVNIFYTPNFSKPGEVELDTISLFPYIKDSFVILGQPTATSMSNPYYSYATIYYNLTTPDGWYPEVKGKDYFDKLSKLYQSFEEKDCKNFISYASQLNTTNFIAYREDCDILNKCGLKEKIKKRQVCLYTK